MEYQGFFLEIKNRVKRAESFAFHAVNKELISLYWDIGKSITIKQEEHKWGSNIVELLALELQKEFVGVKGFSERNLWRMRNFYLTYNADSKLTQLVAEIGWSHNNIILEGCKDMLEREYYILMTRKFGWSRDILANNIRNKSYQNFLTNQTNFESTIPYKQLNDANFAVKDEYSFSFLELSNDHIEKELELGLVNNIRKFLIEMGSYFSFIGNQYRIIVDDEEYFVDLLLYHRKLRCLVVLELKTGRFKPEYAGKMQFYLSAIDREIKLNDENPSIGIIICQDKQRTTVEYTLKDVARPMGVATYTTSSVLPVDVEELLPSTDKIIEHLKSLEGTLNRP